MTIDEAVEILQDIQTVKKSGDGWDLGGSRIATDEEVIQEVERFMFRMDQWVKGYDKHLAEMTDAEANAIESEIMEEYHADRTIPLNHKSEVEG